MLVIAYVDRMYRRDVLPRLWAGVSLAIVAALALGALPTFGTHGLSFQTQETIGGVMSMIAVAVVTWMILWMQRTARTMKSRDRVRLAEQQDIIGRDKRDGAPLSGGGEFAAPDFSA